MATTSAAGRKFITEQEGNKLTAYKDTGGVWTIGVGHTSAAGPPPVSAGDTITAKESDEILARDLKNTEKAVTNAVDVALASHEFDALVSLCFNVGPGGFAGSTVVKKLNVNDRPAAADAFLLWNKDNGVVVPGLTNRRKRERTLFLNGTY